MNIHSSFYIIFFCILSSIFIFSPVIYGRLYQVLFKRGSRRRQGINFEEYDVRRGDNRDIQIKPIWYTAARTRLGSKMLSVKIWLG